MSYQCAKHCSLTSSEAVWTPGFGRYSMPPPICNPDLLPFDLETNEQVASKAGNLHSKCGYTRPLGSRIICYVQDGRTERQTNGQKQHLLPPCLQSGHNKHSSTHLLS